jgi:hypothetical protein
MSRMRFVNRRGSCLASATLLAAVLVAAASHAAGAKPGIATIRPLVGATVSGRISWDVRVDMKRSRVDFAIDGMARWTALGPPYRYGGAGGRLDTRTLTDGGHRLTATARSGRHTSQTSVVVKVQNRASVRRPPEIYWGAYIEGVQTYRYLYGGGWNNVPWDTATWDRFEANAGKRVSIVHYGQPPPWEQPFDVHPASLVTGRGAIPLLSVSSREASLADVANGRYDSSIAAWARAAGAWRKPFFLRWNHEMNGSWFPWGSQARQDPAVFVASWRHVHDLVEAAGATNVTWVWCPNLEFGSSTPYEQLYPGDSYVDWACLDGYNQDSRSVSFASLYRHSYNHLLRLAPTKPIMIGEISSEEYRPGDKARWITDALAVQIPRLFPRIKAVVWFNWRIYQDRRWWNWPIESSAEARAAFAASVNSPSYVSRRALPTIPLRSKVHPPP